MYTSCRLDAYFLRYCQKVEITLLFKNFLLFQKKSDHLRGHDFSLVLYLRSTKLLAKKIAGKKFTERN